MHCRVPVLCHLLHLPHKAASPADEHNNAKIGACWEPIILKVVQGHVCEILVQCVKCTLRLDVASCGVHVRVCRDDLHVPCKRQHYTSPAVPPGHR